MVIAFNKPTMNNANSWENYVRSFFIVTFKCSKLQLDAEPRRSRGAVPTIGDTDIRGKDPFLLFVQFLVSHLLHSFNKLWNTMKSISPTSVYIAFPVKQSRLALNKWIPLPTVAVLVECVYHTKPCPADLNVR